MAYFVIIIILNIKKIPKSIKFIVGKIPHFYDKLNLVHSIISVIKRNPFVQISKYFF